jgi:AbiV family abortive infection protein
MADLDKAKPVIAACLVNAERLLDAAKSTRKPGQNHIAYHLAAVSLEEVGKAAMMLAISFRDSPQPSDQDADEDPPKLMDWIEDHERKLFWALWTPSFGKEKITADQFRQFQSLAKSIHELRLASLYVDAINPTEQGEVSDRELDTILSLAQIRLDMEKAVQPRELDQSQRSLMTWFFQACHDPQMKMVVFSDGSMAKLAEFAGNPEKWMTWLREGFDETDRVNQELAERELNRTEPGKEEGDEPKWQIKLRLKSSSHSIRPKSLTKWNHHVNWIKLFPTKDKKELLVQFTLPKRMHVKEVWEGGLQVSWIFLVAINVGTVGYFWWYLPVFVSKYCEEIVDLENKVNLVVERNPPLSISWGYQALREPDLNSVGLILAHLVRVTPDQKQAYDQYFRALALVAKSDLFGQFEPMILVQFYDAFRSGLKAYGDWDGAPETFEVATELLWTELAVDTTFRADMTGVRRHAEEIARRNPAAGAPTIDEAIKMKVYCDLYFRLRALRELGRRASPSQSTP